MSFFNSRSNTASADMNAARIKKRKLISRQHLRRYSWLPDVFRIKNSVIPRIFWPVLTITMMAALVAWAESNGRSVRLTNSVTPLLAVVVGLIMVFRNGTSYDRFWEGRKSFSAMESGVRSLSRMVWIQVALPPDDTDARPAGAMKGKTPAPDITAAQLHRRKAEVLKLAVAFVYAVKHYVRDEDGLDWDDFTGLIPKSFLRQNASGGVLRYDLVGDGRYGAAFTDSPDKTRPGTPSPVTRDASVARSSMLDASVSTLPIGTGHGTKRVRVKRSIDKLINARTPLLQQPEHHSITFQEASMPLPLIIAHELSRSLFQFRRDGLLETVGPAGANAMNQTVQTLVDQLTALERIANTPIPKSYSIHLKQCVTLYLFALPFTLIRELGWATIPVVTVVAFTFMGIEGIAEEIEHPFGRDEGDLPLDRYCSDLREEVEFMIARMPEGGVGAYGWDDGEGDD
ncbi:hypothetical protein PENSPDRAFT_650349 [Peniophora sp. CONT]|nr:hypothetical protein PENSPDRAFT_650349 [Peniophora sp. CONT]